MTTIDDQEMVDVRAGCVQLGVVAARGPFGIVRAISYGWGLGWQAELREQVERYVGRLTDGVTWSSHRYDVPAYLAYNHLEGLPPFTFPRGVWLFPWVDEAKTVTRDGVRLDRGQEDD